VRELNAGDSAVRDDVADDARQGLDVLVFPEPEITRRYAASGFHRRGLRDDQTGTADGATAEMNAVPVVSEAVVRAVLAHR
jgi:hypothetical protein